MSNLEVSSYIATRLQAGESPAVLAERLHAWGYRYDTSRAPSRINTTSVLDRPMGTISLIIGVSMLFILGVGSVTILQQLEGNTPTSTSVAESQPAESSSFAQLAQQPDPSAAMTERESAVLAAQIDLEEDAATATQAASSSASVDTSSETETKNDDDENAAEPIQVNKSEYTIAIMGDSMIDTLDSHFEQLTEAFEDRYAATFTLYNYGIGAENVAMALERFPEPVEHNNRTLPAIPELQPDVLIIGSFAYNPFDNHDLNNYWIRMAELVDAGRSTGADVYMLAEVAPVREKFALGSLEWTIETRSSHAQKIVDQFNSFINLSVAMNAPLIDAYTPSQAEDNFGNGAYTSLTDGIHANTAGKLLILEEIINTVEIE